VTPSEELKDLVVLPQGASPDEILGQVRIFIEYEQVQDGKMKSMLPNPPWGPHFLLIRFLSCSYFLPILQGPCYSKSLTGGLQIYWKQTQLCTSSNAIATKLVGLSVGGDAVAQLQVAQDVTTDDPVDSLLRHVKGLKAAKLVPEKSSSFQVDNTNVIDCAEGPEWSGLPPELLANVVRVAGCSASVAASMGQVCSAWRASLAKDRVMLQTLRFCSLSNTSAKCRKPSLPWLVSQVRETPNQDHLYV